jgi:DNA segregation ATPase FtsK/SpoIIIE-like protein
MIAAEGRKAGVHLALALQDPTHKSLDLRIRRNCTPLAFRVKDGEASRVILGAGGAEGLAPRQFLTVLGVSGGNATVTRAVAFAPDDEQITTFLIRRSVVSHPRPDWLQLPAPVVEEKTTIIVEQIRQLRAQGHSLNSIQQQMFGYTGGKAYSVVRAALKEAGR